MAARTVCLLLLFAVCLGQQTFHNSAPCQRSNDNNGYNRFVWRHIGPVNPETLDWTEWEEYIEKRGLTRRPLQSFLLPEDENRVRAVCTAEGGKVHMGNLCISLQRFTFYTVKYNVATHHVESVEIEQKYLILACVRLGNQCLPVHFQGNPDNAMPDNNARGCSAPQRWDE